MSTQEQVAAEAIQMHLAGTPKPSRPRETDKFVQERAMELFFPSVEDWLKRENEDDDSIEDAKKEIRKIVFERSRTGDGYELAKELDDRHGWQCNAELVEILDGALGYMYTAKRELVKQWVAAYNIEVPFVVGDQVRVLEGHLKGTVGEVIRIDTAEAVLTVRTPDCTSSMLGYILDVEKVEKA